MTFVLVRARAGEGGSAISEGYLWVVLRFARLVDVLTFTCGSRTAGAVLFFVSPKKSTQKKSDPGLRDTPRHGRPNRSSTRDTVHPCTGRERAHPARALRVLQRFDLTSRAFPTG